MNNGSLFFNRAFEAFFPPLQYVEASISGYKVTLNQVFKENEAAGLCISVCFTEAGCDVNVQEKELVQRAEG